MGNKNLNLCEFKIPGFKKRAILTISTGSLSEGEDESLCFVFPKNLFMMRVHECDETSESESEYYSGNLNYEIRFV